MEEIKKNLNNILLKQDKIQDNIVEIKIDLAKNIVISEKNEENLKEHMKRTELLEQRVDKNEIPLKVLAFIGVPVGLIFAIIMILQALKII